jgi:hypothetical protein
MRYNCKKAPDHGPHLCGSNQLLHLDNHLSFAVKYVNVQSSVCKETHVLQGEHSIRQVKLQAETPLSAVSTTHLRG